MDQAIQVTLEELKRLNKALKQGQMNQQEFKTAFYEGMERRINHELSPQETEALLAMLKRILPASMYEGMVEYVLDKRSQASQEAPPPASPPNERTRSLDEPPPLPTPKLVRPRDEPPLLPAARQAAGPAPAGAQGVRPAKTPAPSAPGPVAPLHAAAAAGAVNEEDDGFTVESGDQQPKKFQAHVFLISMYPVWCLVTYFYNDDLLRTERYGLDGPGLIFDMWHSVFAGGISLILGILLYKKVRFSFLASKMFLVVVILSVFYLSFIHEILFLLPGYERHYPEFNGLGSLISRAIYYMFTQNYMVYARMIYGGLAVIALFHVGGPERVVYPWKR